MRSKLEGAGKSSIDEIVGDAIGEQWWIEIADESQITGQFTSVLANRLLVVMDRFKASFLVGPAIATLL